MKNSEMKILIALFVAVPGSAAEPWRMAASEWTRSDAERVLCTSPWAKAVGRSKVTVRWESSRPIRLALARLNRRSAVADEPSCYAIAVVGLEMPTQAPKLEASLKATGRRAIEAIGLKMQNDGIVFLFPRSEDLQHPIIWRFPMGLKLGNVVQFETRIGNQVIKGKFSLGNMSYAGQLDL